MSMADPMPPRDAVDPAFDGHAERPFVTWTAEQKLDWIWTMMQLLAAGERSRKQALACGEPLETRAPAAGELLGRASDSSDLPPRSGERP
jgi:hypothetical protein